jgi:hypothetical protein
MFFYPENGGYAFLRNVGDNLQDITAQKTTIDIFTAVRISSLSQESFYQEGSKMD